MPRFLEHFMNSVPPSSTQVETTQMSTDAQVKNGEAKESKSWYCGFEKKTYIECAKHNVFLFKNKHLIFVNPQTPYRSIYY